jgi:hypothetical protein
VLVKVGNFEEDFKLVVNQCDFVDVEVVFLDLPPLDLFPPSYG